MPGVRDFHIGKGFREQKHEKHQKQLRQWLFSSRENPVFANLGAARQCRLLLVADHPELDATRAEDLYALGLMDEVFRIVVHKYRESTGAPLISELLVYLEKTLGAKRVQTCIREFAGHFPPLPVYENQMSIDQYLAGVVDGESGYEATLEELIMLHVSSSNPAPGGLDVLTPDPNLAQLSACSVVIEEIKQYFKKTPPFGPDSRDLITMLKYPSRRFPDSLQKQLEFIRDKWGYLLGDVFLKLLRAIDFLSEVNAFGANAGMTFSVGSMDAYEYSGMDEYERFSADSEWMPKVVLMAKSTLVWLDQLSKKYGRNVYRLDQIPDEELDLLASRGFTALWLIGLWQRSEASRLIKERCGNADVAASAYSLYNSEIADEIGGWEALKQLRARCASRGIRLAADMVPNHTGIDSQWIQEHPDWFLQVDTPPYPIYGFTGDNLSSNPGVGIYLEDHYYDHSDAAVVFKRVDFASGHVRYIYHGNDGTHMPWNDTAQLNYLMSQVREAVVETVIQVAKNFPIIRFDAAMTLAKKHIQRLWFPEPGQGGGIASRSAYGLGWEEFNRRMPREFWREVVDSVNKRVPDTLLLAEAFWMMEGYFVRTLGMHRVYNSAFMNMLKMEENKKYRQTIKNTLEFDREILKRFVNFMNNPDEDTTIAQFGDGDKYFGICTLMVTMPGLPMFGHGQIEGFSEKYGMEYRKACSDEEERQWFVDRHNREIFPLLKKRYLFSEVEHFYLFDMVRDGNLLEDVFVYSNAAAMEMALVAYNNSPGHCPGQILNSVDFVEKDARGIKSRKRCSLGRALKLHDSEEFWCVFREVHSNLWYLRKSSEIHRNGLFLSLNGYQCQIFLDIREVRDNEFRHYKQLSDQIKGSGVADIHAAIRDMVLKPVYDAFSAFFTTDYVRTFRDILNGDSKNTEDAFEALEAPYLEFLRQAQVFTEDGKFIEQGKRIFGNGIQRLLRLNELLGEKSMKDERNYFRNPEIYEYGAEERILGYLIVKGLGKYDEEWNLEKKTGEVLGFDPKTGTTMKWSDSRFSWDTPEKSPEIPSGTSSGTSSEKSSEIPGGTGELCAALDNQDVLDAIGSNYFDGAFWFNRELFMEFCWWAMVIQLMYGKDPDAVAIKKSHEQSRGWLEMMEKSEYSLDSLKGLAGTKSVTKEKKPKGAGVI